MGKKEFKRASNVSRRKETGNFQGREPDRKLKQRASRSPRYQNKLPDENQGRPQQEGNETERESHWIDFASKEQRDLIHEEINQFGDKDGPWQALVVKEDNNMFMYTKGSFSSAYLMPREAKDRFKVLMGNPGLKHFGLFLGMFKGEQFNLSMEGASELARAGTVTRNWIKLTEDGEKSFLYGQDVKKAGILGTCKRGITHNRGICIVLNTLDECIGIGKLISQDPQLRSGHDEDTVITNVVDKGVYLRDQDRFA